MGLIALVGGDEFRPGCEAMDRALLDRLGERRHAAILPTAAAHENPRLAGQNGARYFRRLGAQAEAFLAIDRRWANDPALVGALDNFNLIYFTGGDPVHLLETLRDSLLWHAARSVLDRDGLLAGSSAGAMVMGGQVWVPGEGWVPGLGLLPELAILPHHSTLAARWDGRKMAGVLPPGMKLVGIDAATALTFPDPMVWGTGRVSVYGQDGVTAFDPGSRVSL